MEVPIVLIAHNIRSLWNIGSFFRSADAFGISHIHLTGYTSAPERKEVQKTALGAEKTISWSKDLDPIDVVKKRRKEGYEIVALEISEESTPISKFHSRGPVCLILGHEILGVPEALRSISDSTVHIPMQGKKESLNVSVAAGIAMFWLRAGH